MRFSQIKSGLYCTLIILLIYVYKTALCSTHMKSGPIQAKKTIFQFLDFIWRIIQNYNDEYFKMSIEDTTEENINVQALMTM